MECIICLHYLVKNLFARQPKGYVSVTDSASQASSTKYSDRMENKYGDENPNFTNDDVMEKVKNLQASDRGNSNATAVPAYQGRIIYSTKASRI